MKSRQNPHENSPQKNPRKNSAACDFARVRPAVLIICVIFFAVAAAFADFSRAPAIDPDNPAIEYTTKTLNDPGYQLNLKLQRGEVHLKYEPVRGYLRSVLDALDVPVESQMVVFSKTSFQAERISPTNPRSLFFNDSVVVGWVHGGGIIEVAAEDPRQGMIFYILSQKLTDPPRLERDVNCLNCHVSSSSLGVPGTLMRSVFPGADGAPMSALGNYLTDDRSPLAQRWGGWYVTGVTGAIPHLGNAVFDKTGTREPLLANQSLDLKSLQSKFDTNAYLTPYSDVVALMVFEHEMHMMNLFTRVGWEVRMAQYRDEDANASSPSAATARILRDTSRELVDYMLFADEAPLTSKIEGTSGFEEKFSSEGPRDSQGRSLRQFDLEHRLMRYPCSYMIYSDAFDALPDEAKDAIYARMWKLLSGQEKDKKYARLTLADRQAIVEILRDTKRRLPAYFQGAIR
jgi:hypothetical protein